MLQHQVPEIANDSKNPFRVISILESNKKRMRVLASKNGTQAKIFSFERTSNGHCKDQYGHPYDFELTELSPAS